MFKIIILAVGKLKTSFYQQACREYLKRLQPYGKVEIREVKPESFTERADRDRVKRAEGERLLKEIKKIEHGCFFVLDEHGTEYTSSQLVGKLTNCQGLIVFVVGGTLGLSKEVLHYPGFQKLALSQMTLPHELARVMLIEQIYRAITILKNKNYHY
ncbi:23S rRNA (pseudouridine(1915)-N(3))-methyltransferase RlmH [Patescibacteria group bacterium]|nr:23S rRNA (pseudouridine(1915)-N(3))-methyltransferase RlmH [Patescibacteria group bacterium]